MIDTVAQSIVAVATWNARRSLGANPRAHATDFVERVAADLLVVPEYGRSGCVPEAIYCNGRGGGRYGMAVMARTGTVDIVRPPSDRLPCVLALNWRLGNCREVIRILAIWATDYKTRCLLTTWFALEEWLSWLTLGPGILLGDLNQSAIWDDHREPLSFSDMTNKLEGRGFSSAYHQWAGEAFGKESAGTYDWMRSGSRKTAHTDYVFFNNRFHLEGCQLIDGPSDHRAVRATLSLTDAGGL
jgi:hypothetical protein